MLDSPRSSSKRDNKRRRVSFGKTSVTEFEVVGEMFRIKKKRERARASSPRQIDVRKLGSAKQNEHDAHRRAQALAEEIG